jgi:hypothetical protein
MKSHPKDGARPARSLHKSAPHRTVGGIQVNGIAVEYESYNERNAIFFLAICHDVIQIRSQPIRLSYTDEKDRSRHHIPDFEIMTSDGDVCYLEIKAIENLLQPDNLQKYSLIAKAYIKQQLALKFLTNIQIEQQPLFDVAKLLFRYHNFPVSTQLIQQASLVLANGGMDIREYLQITNAQLRDVYALIAQKHITFDLNRPLGMSSSISLPNQPYQGVTFEKIVSSTRFGDFLERLAMGHVQANQSLMATAKAWRQLDNRPQLWGVVGGFCELSPLRDALQGEFCRSPGRRRDSAPGQNNQNVYFD